MVLATMSINRDSNETTKTRCGKSKQAMVLYYYFFSHYVMFSSQRSIHVIYFTRRLFSHYTLLHSSIKTTVSNLFCTEH